MSQKDLETNMYLPKPKNCGEVICKAATAGKAAKA